MAHHGDQLPGRHHEIQAVKGFDLHLPRAVDLTDPLSQQNGLIGTDQHGDQLPSRAGRQGIRPGPASYPLSAFAHSYRGGLGTIGANGLPLVGRLAPTRSEGEGRRQLWGTSFKDETDGRRSTRGGSLTVPPPCLRGSKGAQAFSRYVASTCRNALGGYRPFRPVRAGGTDPGRARQQGEVRDIGTLIAMVQDGAGTRSGRQTP